MKGYDFEKFEDLLRLLSEKHDIIKELNIRFSAPDEIQSFNVEYFRAKIPTLPGGVQICE